jgi:exosortase
MARKSKRKRLVILIFALMVLVLGTINSGFFLSRVPLLFLICGLVVFLAGWKHLAAISFPLGFLIFMIPSSTLVDQITFPLQILASKTATFLLTGIGVPAIREGKHHSSTQCSPGSGRSL